MKKNNAFWTPEKRAEYAERRRRMNADPDVMKKCVAGMRTPESRKRRAEVGRRVMTKMWAEQPEKMRAQWASPKRKERARQGTIAYNEKVSARIRGGAIPEGYEAMYRHLRRDKHLPAREALRLVRLQRDADLRKAA